MSFDEILRPHTCLAAPRIDFLFSSNFLLPLVRLERGKMAVKSDGYGYRKGHGGVIGGR